MRVLIAEDEKVSRLVLRKALEEMGYSVLVAQDGAEAWELFNQHAVPLVISDWMMPSIDGIQLCRLIREQHDKGYVYFILLTARDSKEDRFHAIEAGADDFLTKPLDRAELASRLSVSRRILDMEQRLREVNRELAAQKEELELKTQALELSQEMIQQANLRFRELFDNVPVACFTIDAEGAIYEWNLTASKLYGWQAYEVLSRSLFDTIIKAEDEQHIRALIRQVMQGEEYIIVEGVDRCRDGSQLHVLRNLFPLHGGEGQVVGAICANVDITKRIEYEQELRALNERLASLAFSDALTGLLNHRALQDKLSELMNTAKRDDTPFSVLMVDIDHFKRLNDTYGHQTGDEILRLVARKLQESTPPQSILARYGGEEFCVLLPGIKLPEAVCIAERLRQAIEQLETPYRQVTASFGAAMYKPYMRSTSEVIEVADAALYEAKRAGRNCVRPVEYDVEQHAA